MSTDGEEPMRLKFLVAHLLLIILFFTIDSGSQNAALSRPLLQNASTPPKNISSLASSTMQRDYTESMLSAGLIRTYYIHLPLSYNKQQVMPLVLAFHGSSATGK